MEKGRYKCPVCEFDFGMTNWEDSLQMCPGCGIEFGYNDAAGGVKQRRPTIYQYWREAWIQNGKKPLTNQYEKEVHQRINKEFASKQNTG